MPASNGAAQKLQMAMLPQPGRPQQKSRQPQVQPNQKQGAFNTNQAIVNHNQGVFAYNQCVLNQNQAALAQDQQNQRRRLEPQRGPQPQLRPQGQAGPVQPQPKKQENQPIWRKHIVGNKTEFSVVR